MCKVRVGIILLFVGLFSSILQAQSIYPGQHSGKLSLATQAPVAVRAFDLNEVRLLDSPFKENMERESQWILSLDADRLLHSFRNTAGVWAGLEGGYSAVEKLGGWESLDCELRGHTTGHILSGLAYLYASTGEEKYKIKSDSLIRGMVEVQNALMPYHQGYISAYSEHLIDRVIAGARVWAPWYTLHKIYAGLIDQYLYCENEEALRIMTAAASWAYNKLYPLSDQQKRTMLRNEFGGVNEAFYNLYSITGSAEHRWLAEFFYHNDVIDPLADGRDELEGKHANTFIPKIIGETRNYELTESPRSRQIAEFFWQTVIDHQTYCTGGNSHKEKFIPSDQLSHYLTGYTQESCNTNNMLKLTRHLFCWDASPLRADYYERALYNHILGQQDPQTGMIAYFLPLLPGAHKVYSTYDRSFWCCVGTGFENHAKYGEAIYYHTDHDLYVNLFIPSQLKWKEKAITLTQETRFPESETVTFTVRCESPVRFGLKLRYPDWSSGVEVKVNGRKQPVVQTPSSYITISRLWKDGDQVEVRYPMKIRLVAANDNPAVAALAYGPLILAATLGSEGMMAPAPFSDPHLHNDYYTYDYRVPENLPNTLSIDPDNLNAAIQPVDGEPLRFVYKKGELIFEPIHRIHRQRYTIYWSIEHIK